MALAFATVFRRYELKYLLTEEQKERILAAMAPYMELDRYGRTTIRNVYYDTEDYRLIRRSIEKPIYKEKLRVRSYARADRDSTVFVELKKKYKKVVYKRRLAVTQAQAVAWLEEGGKCPVDSQIGREIDYFLHFYGRLRPTVFLSYQREAYYQRDGGEFRVTFDDHILCRRKELSLTKPTGGDSILEEGKVLMELKCPGAIPLWMVEVLSRERIYKTSFSKYGTAYCRYILPNQFQRKPQENTTQEKEKQPYGTLV